MAHKYVSKLISSLMCKIYDVRFSDLDADLACCKKLLEIGMKHNDAYAVCFAYTYLGDYYHAVGDFVESEQNLVKSRAYCELYDFGDLLLDNYLFSGHLFRRIGNEQRALDYFLAGIALSQKLNKAALTSTFYNSIAVIFNSLGEHSEAMKCFEIAYTLHGGQVNNDTDLRRYVILLANISEVACEAGLYDRAKSALQEAEVLILNSKLDPMEFLSVYFAKVCCAAVEDSIAMNGVLEELYALKPEECIDKGLVFDTFITIANKLLDLKEYNSLERVLGTLSVVCKGTEYEHSLKLQSFKIRHWRDTHEDDDNIHLYKDFYAAYINSDTVSQEMKAAGLMAKISLQRTLEEREAELEHSRQLEEAAYYDELTKSYNRRYLKDFTEKLHNDNIPRRICAAMIDLDYFKEFNDTYGHMSGDAALRTVADCLRKCDPKNGFVVRYGGDEFVCICCDLKDGDMAKYLKCVQAELARRAIEHKKSACPSKTVTLSIGYSCMQVQNSAEFETLLANADRALYISKYKGRNTITCLEQEGGCKANRSDQI